MKQVAFALLACSFFTLAQTPAPKRPMTFADLMAMRRVSDPQISPSGKWVLFSVTDVSLEKNSKDKPPVERPTRRQLRRNARSPAAAANPTAASRPDGKWVMYSSSETGSGQIWLAPWDEAKGTVGAGHAT